MAALACASMSTQLNQARITRSQRTQGSGLRVSLPVRSLRARVAGRANASRRSLVVRADEGFNVEKALAQYKSISYKIPPTVSAATLPVVSISILVKTLTGHGLPGTFLGTVEGVSWLVLLLGAGSLLPRLSSIIAGADYSMDAIMEVLTAKDDGSSGRSATERVYGASAAKNSPLAEQMMDLKKRQAEKDAETPEETAARLALKAKLAQTVLGNAKKTQDSYNEEKGADDKLLKKSATETISECMTQENFDKPINEFTDDDLNDKVNLSKSKIEDGAPTVVGKGDDWRKKNFEEAEKRTKGSKPKGEQEA
eukprot:CAMPEP_0114248642 /NCGR_PEP_ID=MMETSP0058-20121206/13688_1 /TAXON_ID=36894 /ORGANISM="Pyramimonas parkeae, CCMP726" /LENGTH=310 /DNA_ID=CAMNT_0001362075 /DNA_START=48 /DNA_END=980 /DNA_ORIENTATION=-